MPTYRIGRPGAQHRKKVNGVWLVFRRGDIIELSQSQVAALSHLDLTRVDAVPTQRRAEDVERAKEPEDIRRDQKSEDQKSEELTTEELKAMIDEVDATDNAKSFNAVRKDIVERGVLDSVPQKKAALLEALQALLPESDGDDGSE